MQHLEDTSCTFNASTICALRMVWTEEFE